MQQIDDHYAYASNGLANLGPTASKTEHHAPPRPDSNARTAGRHQFDEHMFAFPYGSFKVTQIQYRETSGTYGSPWVTIEPAGREGRRRAGTPHSGREREEVTVLPHEPPVQVAAGARASFRNPWVRLQQLVDGGWQHRPGKDGECLHDP